MKRREVRFVEATSLLTSDENQRVSEPGSLASEVTEPEPGTGLALQTCAFTRRLASTRPNGNGSSPLRGRRRARPPGYRAGGGVAAKPLTLLRVRRAAGADARSQTTPPDNLTITVKGVATIRLPVTAGQGSSSRMVARPARFDKGEETILGPRRTRHLGGTTLMPGDRQTAVDDETKSSRREAKLRAVLCALCIGASIVVMAIVLSPELARFCATGSCCRPSGRTSR